MINLNELILTNLNKFVQICLIEYKDQFDFVNYVLIANKTKIAICWLKHKIYKKMWFALFILT